MTEDLSEISGGLAWHENGFVLNDTPFVPKIFDVLRNEEPIPEGFNAVKLKVDGRLKADLKWLDVREKAQKYSDSGYKIFWELDLGLFRHLFYPFSYEGQYKALQFSVQNFWDFLWSHHQKDSLGVCLYRGTTDFTLDFPWSRITKDANHYENLQQWLRESFQDVKHFSHETGIEATSFDEVTYLTLFRQPVGLHLMNIYCRNVAIDYLDFLTQDVPDHLPMFVMLDAFPVTNPAYLAQVISRERFERYHLAIRGGSLPQSGLAWDDDRATCGYIAHRHIALREPKVATVGVCLPPMDMCLPSHYKGLEQALTQLNDRKIDYRVIPEPFLTTEWSGLDNLLFIPSGLSDLGERKLQGFCAAGGIPISLGQKIGLPHELTFDEWTEKLLEIM